MHTLLELTWCICRIQNININRDVDLATRDTVLDLLYNALRCQSIDVSSSEDLKPARLVIPEIIMFVGNRCSDTSMQRRVPDQAFFVGNVEESPMIDASTLILSYNVTLRGMEGGKLQPRITHAYSDIPPPRTSGSQVSVRRISIHRALWLHSLERIAAYRCVSQNGRRSLVPNACKSTAEQIVWLCDHHRG